MYFSKCGLCSSIFLLVMNIVKQLEDDTSMQFKMNKAKYLVENLSCVKLTLLISNFILSDVAKNFE